MTEWDFDKDKMKYGIIDSEVYQLIGYCGYPTLIFKNIRTGQTEHIVPESPFGKSIIKLAPEEINNG